MAEATLMNRRRFLQISAASIAAVGSTQVSWASELPTPAPKKLPRWRGFNLLEKFTARRRGNPPYRESDFEAIAELGFNFVRLPMSYQCWVESGDWRSFRESQLKDVDEAVEFGRRYQVHICLNFHRAPGYCVNPPPEPFDLWSDEEALEVCTLHWTHFAKRYQGIPNSNLSFDLINEPKDMPEQDYAGVVRHLVGAIHDVDPGRLIIADGLKWGTKPVLSLSDLDIAQSTRGYGPSRISHYKANWVSGSADWPVPSWPLVIREGDKWDKARLRREYIEPWKALENQGVGVHVGEWGAYRYTPHAVALAWMRDWLELWQGAGWGWALWNFRGTFGVLDSEREDVEYETWRGHQLDRAMLELLQAY